jgi:APA family basic amino acid/polyamine antiporter
VTSYARRIGLFSATMLVVGGIIGSGIFLNPAIVAQRVGTPGLTVGSWVLGGVVTLLGALCFAELGAQRPQVGGGYAYLREAFGPLPAFLYGWALLLVIATGATAAVAVTFARYLAAFLSTGDGATVPVAVAAIVVLSIVNILGVRPGSLTVNVFTILKLVAIAAVIAAGLLAAPVEFVPANQVDPPLVPVGPLPVFVAIGAALVPILFAYGGWQQTNFVAEEMVEPERNLPRALVTGTAIVVLVYVLANLAYVRALGVPGLAASPAPAADVLGAALGDSGRRAISLGIACSTFGFLNLVILVTPRVYQAMAADGVFFPRLAALHPRYRTPALAIALQGAWAVVLALSGTYEQLLDYVVFGDWIFFGLCAATLFVFRRREGPPPRFRVPLWPLPPALFILAALYVMASSVGQNPGNAAIGTALLLAGVPVYAFWKRRRPSSVVRRPNDERPFSDDG